MENDQPVSTNGLLAQMTAELEALTATAEGARQEAELLGRQAAEKKVEAEKLAARLEGLKDLIRMVEQQIQRDTRAALTAEGQVTTSGERSG